MTCKKKNAANNKTNYVLHSCKCPSCILEDRLCDRMTDDIEEYCQQKGLPVVNDYPPMPKCKPPKPEVLEEEMFALHDVLSNPKEIKIESVEQIIERMIHDGDLREHDFNYAFVCCVEDDLGFYQQSCEFLVKELAEIQTCKEGHRFVAKSHEYICPLCQLDEVRKHLK